MQHVLMANANMEMILILVSLVLLIYICVGEDLQQPILAVFQTVALILTHLLGYNQDLLVNSKLGLKLLLNINVFYVLTIYQIV